MLKNKEIYKVFDLVGKVGKSASFPVFMGIEKSEVGKKAGKNEVHYA